MEENVFITHSNQHRPEQILIFFKDGSTCNSASRIKNALDNLKNAFNKDDVDENEVKNIYDEIDKHCGDSSFIFKNEQEKNDKIGFVFCTSDQDIEKFLKYPDQKEYNDCKIVLAYKHGSSKEQFYDNEKHIKIDDVKKFWEISKPLADGVSLPGNQQKVYEGDKNKVRYSKQGCEDVEIEVIVYDINETKYYKIDNNNVIFKSAEEAGIEFYRIIKLKVNVNLNDATILLDNKKTELDDKNRIRVSDDGKEHKLTINKTGYKHYSCDIKRNQESININLQQINKINLPSGNSVVTTETTITGDKEAIKEFKDMIKENNNKNRNSSNNNNIIGINGKTKEGDEEPGTKPKDKKNIKKSDIFDKIIAAVVIGLVIGLIGCYIFMTPQKNELANFQDDKEAWEDSRKEDSRKNDSAISYLKNNDVWLKDDSHLTGTLYESLPSYFVNGEIDSIINSPYNKIEEKNGFFKTIVEKLKEIRSDSKKKKIVATDIKNVCKNKSVDLKKISDEVKKKVVIQIKDEKKEVSIKKIKAVTQAQHKKIENGKKDKKNDQPQIKEKEVNPESTGGEGKENHPKTDI